MQTFCICQSFLERDDRGVEAAAGYTKINSQRQTSCSTEYLVSDPGEIRSVYNGGAAGTTARWRLGSWSNRLSLLHPDTLRPAERVLRETTTSERSQRREFLTLARFRQPPHLLSKWEWPENGPNCVASAFLEDAIASQNLMMTDSLNFRYCLSSLTVM